MWLCHCVTRLLQVLGLTLGQGGHVKWVWLWPHGCGFVVSSHDSCAGAGMHTGSGKDSEATFEDSHMTAKQLEEVQKEVKQLEIESEHQLKAKKMRVCYRMCVTCPCHMSHAYHMSMSHVTCISHVHVTCHMSSYPCHMSSHVHVTCHHMSISMSHVTCRMSHVTCHMSHVACRMSHVTCHMSHVACRMSHVTCHMHVPLP